MVEAKSVNVLLEGHFKLSKAQEAKTEDKKALMSKVLYAIAVGSLMYVMIYMRSDIDQAVGIVSRYMNNPEQEQYSTIKWILTYLKGSLDMALCNEDTNVYLDGYVDFDFVGDIDSQRSIANQIFTLGNRAVSWVSRLQKIVSLYTTETEYVTAT